MNINKIVIAGAGTMGYSMAQIFAQFAKKRISENIDILIDEKEITSQQGQEIMSYLSYTTSKDCFKDCDLVVENIIENVDIKKSFYKDISQIVSENCILATNTSGISMNLLVQ